MSSKKKGKSERASSFIELQVAVVLACFAIVNMGHKLLSTNKQIRALQKYQEEHFFIHSPILFCNSSGVDDLPCEYPSTIVEWQENEGGIEALVARNF